MVYFGEVDEMELYRQVVITGEKSMIVITSISRQYAHANAQILLSIVDRTKIGKIPKAGRNHLHITNPHTPSFLLCTALRKPPATLPIVAPFTLAGLCFTGFSIGRRGYSSCGILILGLHEFEAVLLVVLTGTMCIARGCQGI